MTTETDWEGHKYQFLSKICTQSTTLERPYRSDVFRNKAPATSALVSYEQRERCGHQQRLHSF